MEKIIYPLQFRDRNPEVKNLQSALLAISELQKDWNLNNLLAESMYRRTLEVEVAEWVYEEATRQAVTSFQEHFMKVTPTGEIDEPTADALNALLVKYKLIAAAAVTYTITGTAYDEWLRPLLQSTVRAFDKGMRKEMQIGEAVTDELGAYYISFKPAAFAKAGKQAPDVFVRLYARNGKVIKTSGTYYNAPATLNIDLNLAGKAYAGPSELEKVIAAIQPLIGRTNIAKLTENDEDQDISFLANKTKLASSVIVTLVMAYRMEEWTELAAPVWYGLLRMTPVTGSDAQSTDPDSLSLSRYNVLLSLSAKRMSVALQNAIDGNIVPFALTADLADIKKQWQELTAAPPLPPGQKQLNSSLYQTMALAGLSAEQRQEFVGLNPATANDPAFWKKLGEQASFAAKPAAVDKLQAVIRLSTTVADNIGLVTAVLKDRKIRKPADLTALAGLDAAAWKEMLARNKSAVPANTTIADYSVQLTHTFEKVYPMAAFAGGIGRDAEQKDRSATHWTANVSSFLSANPDFDFATHHVNLFLQDQKTISKTVDRDTLSTQLMGVQRLYKLAPSFDSVSSLVQGGVLSAQQIYGMGKSNFSAKYKGQLGQYQPEDVYEKAALQYGGALAIVGRLNGMRSISSLAQSESFSREFERSTVAAAYPGLNTLFGLSDYCECKDCRSFLSQSAYLTDILEFLNQRDSTYKVGGTTYKAREILLANGRYPLRLPSRRPDIGDIDLNCKNTNVQLPYIDLVNELLEDYIALPAFNIAGHTLTLTDLAPGQISANLLKAILITPGGAKPHEKFIYNIALLTDQAIVSLPFRAVEFPYWLYIIRDRFITLKLFVLVGEQDIDRGTQQISVRVQELHETHLTADQIKASPEYVNINVYDQLSTATAAAYPDSIPFGLPFDLYFVSANLFLDKMGIHQYQLKRDFRKEQLSAAADIVEHLLIAAAYFGLSIAEYDLIFLPTAFDTMPEKLWGTVIMAEVAALGGPEVDTFLEYTGLTYEQLVGLLQLVSINGTGAATLPPAANMSQIRHEDGPLSCDTSRMYITRLGNPSKIITNQPFEAPMPHPPRVHLSRIDLIDRLLRLQPKTKLTLAELDACLRSTSIGNWDIDAEFSVQLMYLQQLMTDLSLEALPVLSFFQRIDTDGKNSLYQQLFQNLAISNPLNPKLNIVNFGATNIDDATNAPGVMQIIMTACRIRMDDLQTLLEIIRGGVATAPAPINLDTLSFIYRYGVLANALNLSVEDLVTLIRLVDIKPLLPYPAGGATVIKPEATWRFLNKWKKIGKAGLTVDGLNYLLTNQSDETPSLVPDSATVAAGLTAIRTALQTVIAGTAVAPDPKGLLLTQWLNDPLLNWDKTIAAKLIKILSTTDDASFAQQVMLNSRMLQLLSLQYAKPSMTAYLPALPAISFPDATVTGLSYDATTAYLGVTGLLAGNPLTYMLSLSGNGTYQTAVNALAAASTTQPYTVTPLAALPGSVAFPDKNIPLVSYFTGSLSFAGPMSGAVYNALYGVTEDADFRYAVDRLFVYSQDFAAGAVVTVPLAALPAIAFPDATITSINWLPAVAPAVGGTLTYDGAMSLADYNALNGVSTDAGYRTALKGILVASTSEGTASVPLAALPAWSFSFPDLNSANLSWAAPSLKFKGVMSPADLTAFLALSDDPLYKQAAADLFVISTAGISSTVLAKPIVPFALPDANILSATLSGGKYMFTGSMSIPDLLVLLSLSADVNYKTAICTLFAQSQDGVNVSATPAALPAAPVVFPDASIAAMSYVAGSLGVTGKMSLATSNALKALGYGGAFNAAVGNLFTISASSLPTTVVSKTVSAPVLAFPDAQMKTIAVNTVAGVTTMSFTGKMSIADFQGLAALEADTGYQQSLRLLFALSQLSPILNSTPFTPPASWTFTWPDSNIGNLVYSGGQLQFTGQMSPTDLACLLGVSGDPVYQTAIKTLYAQSQVSPLTNATPAVIPTIALPDAKLKNIGYQKGMLVCNKVPSVADLNNFTQVNDDPEQQQLFFFLHQSALGTSATTLAALPPISIPTGIAGLTYSDGILQLVGKMQPADKLTLLQLSPNADYQDVINRLDANSQLNLATTVNAIALPLLPIVSLAAVPSVTYSNGILSITAAMSGGDMTKLLGYSDYVDYQLAMNELYILSHYPWASTSIGLMYPVSLTPPDLSRLPAPATVVYTDGSLYCPASPVADADFYALCGLSSDPSYLSAVKDLYLKAAAAGAGTAVSSVPFALPAIGIPAIYATQVSYDASLQTLELTAYVAKEDLSALLGLSDDTYFQVAIDALYDELTGQMTDDNIDYQPFSADVAGDLLAMVDGNAPDLMIPARFAWALDLIQPVYLRLREAAALNQQVVNLFQIKAPLAAQLIGYGTDFFFDRLTDPSFVQSARPINEISYFDQSYIFYSAARICFLINQYKMSAADLAWLLSNSVGAGALDLLALPGNWTVFGGPLNANASFAQWEVLNAFFVFQRKYNAITIVDAAEPGAKIPCSVFTIVQHATDIYSAFNPAPGDPIVVTDPEALIDELVQLTKWDEADIRFMVNLAGSSAVNPLNLSIDNPVLGSVISLATPALLNRLLHCIVSAQQLGVPVSRSYNWSSPDPAVSYTLADDIKQGLKSRSATPALWAKVIVPLENTLREARRDALLAYILANHAAVDDFMDKYDVYSKFLIDLEMSSCQPTTRMLQAYCSVQLFVQRCMLSLEPHITVVTASTTAAIPFDEDWSQWSWMSTYEKWRQNRMVFLYPENYIRPELLPGQSSFFSDMRNDLTQSPATKELAETALMNYTIGLDTIGQLQAKAQWYDDVTDVLHVFACTYGGPPVIWYYRRKDVNDIWTAWEKVDLDIQDGIVVPAVLNGRLFLFWPIFKKMSQDATSNDAAQGSQRKASKYWNIQLACSEYQSGKWSPKKISADSINSMIITDYGLQQIFPDKGDFVFIAWNRPDIGGNMIIACYYCNNNNFTHDLYSSSSSIWADGYYTDQLGDPSVPNADLPPTVNLFDQTISGPGVQHFMIWNRQDTPNAFQYDPCSGLPQAFFLGWPLTVPQTEFFANEGSLNFTSGMLVYGFNPLTVKNEFATILEPAPLPTTPTPTPIAYDNLPSTEMSYFDQYLYTYSSGADYNVGTLLPFFYGDGTHNFFVQQGFWNEDGTFMYSYANCRNSFVGDPGGYLGTTVNTYLSGVHTVLTPIRHFYNFRHPYACDFIKFLFANGSVALETRDVQLSDSGFSFYNYYNPTTAVYPDYPKDDVDFQLDHPYGLYNWELFYHGVLLTAMNLSQNRQFEDADKWFKYIFNPTDTSGYPSPQKFWVTKPLFLFGSSDTLTQLITELDEGAAPGGFVQSVTAMREDPYDPFRIANDRITPYMVTAVMKYLDNLFAWADSLFTVHTPESVSTALQLYQLMQELLGPEPAAIPPGEKAPIMNYYQLEASLAAVITANTVNNEIVDNPWPSVSDPLVAVESMVPVSPGSATPKMSLVYGKVPSVPSLLYFCIPPNRQLLQYWTNVADRLYKIRHCENILGQYDPLSAYGDGEFGLGGDPDDLNDLNGLQLYYRFVIMMQKATELVNDVKSLGGELLSALEKKDAEDLARIRAGQEINVQNSILAVRLLQVQEANDNVANITNYIALINTKVNYYKGLLATGINDLEALALGLNMIATALEGPIALGYGLAAPLNFIPDFVIGVSGIASPVAEVKEGGAQFSAAVRDTVSMLSTISQSLDKSASIMNVMSGYGRRADEWQFQLDLANAELTQAGSQLAAAQHRVQIATQEQQNQEMLIQNANDINDFLVEKFTNKELYMWMSSQLSNTYFASNQLATSIAKKTETCFRFELGLSTSNYIKTSYWDSLKNGLLSGEQLLGDLKQMEMDYLRLNEREFELTKHISMAVYDPVALVQLKRNANCFINFPEEIFDMDYPGHYFRRIKSISLTIPCVAGPYTTVSCTLTLTGNAIRISNDASGKYPRKVDASGRPADDSRFGDNAGMLQSIATSSGVNDNGLFELNFHDERYLPFEFVGAISSWYLQLPQVLPQFDYQSISDLILHVRYTARDGGSDLISSAADHVRSVVASSITTPGLGLYRLFSAKRDFSTAWYQFLNAVDSNGNQSMELDITDRFPYFVRSGGLSVAINRIDVLADSELAGINLQLTSAGQTQVAPNLSQANDTNDDFGGLLYSSQLFGMNKPGLGKWKVGYSAAGNPGNSGPLSRDTIKDLCFVVYYSVVSDTVD